MDPLVYLQATYQGCPHLEIHRGTDILLRVRIDERDFRISCVLQTYNYYEWRHPATVAARPRLYAVFCTKSLRRIMSAPRKSEICPETRHPSACESTLGAQMARIGSLIMRGICAGAKLERHIFGDSEGWPTPPATACF